MLKKEFRVFSNSELIGIEPFYVLVILCNCLFYLLNHHPHLLTTTTVILFENTSTMGSFMLPGMCSPEQASCSRVVRFDNECVLIPKTSLSRSKLPVVLTKSYSLPLWKRRTQQCSDSELEDPAGSSAQPQSSEDNRVTIKVPIPTFVNSSFLLVLFKLAFSRFRRRSPSSPTQTRPIPSPTIASSLPSCLARRASSESTSSSVKPVPIRRPSLPVYHRRQDELTVPLRDCCADCQRITEECLKEGNDWKEKFSRGARRRRSASLEYSKKPALPHTRNSSVNGAFTPFSSEGSACRDPTSKFATTTAFSITVDEVDKRRRSFDFSMDDTDLTRTQQSHPSASPFASSSGRSVYPRTKQRDHEASSGSTVSSVSAIDELPPSPDTLDSRNRLRSSPIEEEDETQLFPLPRRSRSKTPSPSPPPSPIPNESCSSLPVIIPSSPYLSPTSSKWKSSSSDESILRDSSCKVEDNHLIAPTVSTTKSRSSNAVSTSSSSLSLRLPTTGAPTEPVSPRRSDTETTKPFSAIPSKSPSANKALSEISDQNTPSLLAPPSSNLTSSDNINSTPPFKPKIETAKTVTNHKSTPPSAFSDHTSSLISEKPSQRKRKISFTLPFIKAGGAIRDVGAEVLRGVGSISGSGGLVGSV